MNEVHVNYTCGCWQYVRVDNARGSTCQKHGTEPVRVNTHEWRVRCPDCKYGRWCDQSKEEALRGQTAHVKRYPTHSPSVAYDRVTIDGKGSILRWDNGRVRRRSGGMIQANGTDNVPPF